MANNEHMLFYKEIEEDEGDKMKKRHGLEMLRHYVREQSKYLDEDIRPISMQAEKKGTRNGLNFQLPGNIDFRVEDGRIIFSEFGMTKEELQTVYKFLGKMGFTGLSVSANEDEPFKELVKEAYKDMANADGYYESSPWIGDALELETPTHSANSNSVEASEGDMSDEDRILYARKMAEKAKETVHSKPLPSAPKKVHPSVDDIDSYIETFVEKTHKYKSRNYRKRSRANGWEVIIYKDEDQKKDGPSVDKKGHYNPNFEFGLRGEIVKNSGKPQLKITFLTPKYGDMADWMFDEVMNMADTCKVTHLKFDAGLQHKSKFFVACGKKMIIPTGIKLKVKDLDEIYKAAKKNNDDPEKKASFYLFLAEQLEDNMRDEHITNEAHPFVEWSKRLRDDAKNEAEASKAAVKYKKFNQFFEGNIMGKIYPDNDDKPISAINNKGIQPDAVNQLAMGRAYVEFLVMYRDDDNFANSSDEVKKQKYLDLYNKNVYKFDKELDRMIGSDEDENETLATRKDKKDLIDREYKNVNSEIKSLSTSLKNDLGVDIETPDLINRSYRRYKGVDRNGNKILVNKNRIQKGRMLAAIEERENEQRDLTPLWPERRSRA